MLRARRVKCERRALEFMLRRPLCLGRALLVMYLGLGARSKMQVLRLRCASLRMTSEGGVIELGLE